MSAVRWEDDWLPSALCGGQYQAIDKPMCADCPVRSECLQHALSSPWRPHGIWAGMDEADLFRLWQERHPNRGSQEEVFELIGLYRDERGREPGKD